MLRCRPEDMRLWSLRAELEGHSYDSGSSVGPIVRRALNAYLADERVQAAVRLYHVRAREARIASSLGGRLPEHVDARLTERFVVRASEEEQARWEAQALREGYESGGRGAVNTLARQVMSAYVGDLTVLGAVSDYYHARWIEVFEKNKTAAPAATQTTTTTTKRRKS